MRGCEWGVTLGVREEIIVCYEKAAPSQGPLRKREVCKKVSWSRYDSVNISGHLLMLPRRFANLEIIKAGTSRTVCSGADLLTEENVIIRRTLLKDQEQTAQVYHNLKVGTPSSTSKYSVDFGRL
ncbi:hypothetical protein KIN20_036419 [Parelaphostrongylus tenuis]|uniref:Uncharacterized protein n=1 Tax=Parelaphostrongylus tenuis TaxID=148309 RepID=A0AAD5RD01_PARTN|nr:hypothetical protein KIN20_036419 [Parelaphostrongylus tenuis]